VEKHQRNELLPLLQDAAATAKNSAQLWLYIEDLMNLVLRVGKMFPVLPVYLNSNRAPN
jgi:hypothetical protein